MAEVQPEAVELRPQELLLQWPDAAAVSLTAQRLRQRCPCAQCRQLQRQGGAVDAAVTLQLVGASPVGSYGVQLHFDDGHDRGIYPWVYLKELAER